MQLTPTTRAHAQAAGWIAGLGTFFPPLALLGSLLLLLLGLVSYTQRAWKGLLLGVAISAAAAFLVAYIPLLAVAGLPVLLWLIRRRWLFVKRYWPALWQGLRLHSVLLLWGGLGTWGVQLVWERGVVDALVQHLLEPWHVGVLVGVGGLWVALCRSVAARVRLRWDHLSWEQYLHGAHPDYAVMFAAGAPLLCLLLLLPLAKFDAVLLMDQFHHLMDPTQVDAEAAISSSPVHSSQVPGTHHVNAHIRHTAHGIEHVQGHTRTNPDGISSNNRS